MALVYLVNKPQVSRRVVRWLLLFLEYDFTIVYKLNRIHVIVDALSRLLDITKPIGDYVLWFNFGDYVLWFPKGNKSHLGIFIKKWFGLYKVQYVLPNNTVLLVTIEKFETNLVLVNVNKVKPYKYRESKV
jgi:hypothetical protein